MSTVVTGGMHALGVVVFSLSCQVGIAFHHPYSLPLGQREGRKVAVTGVISRSRTTAIRLSVGGKNKGFGGAASSSSRNKKKPIASQPATKKAQNVKDIERKLTQKYGGTSPDAIARGTQAVMAAAMAELPEPVQRAARLYQSIRTWDARHADDRRYNSILFDPTNRFDPSQLADLQSARDEYRQLCLEFPHQVSDRHLQQLCQRLTWDAAADAKAARVASGGTMKADLKRRIQTACKWVKESLGDDDESSMCCLDVGCGYGAIVPDLLDAGLRADQIHGLDLSAEMIRNAKTMYAGGPTFEVASFYDFTNGPRLSKHVGAIIFCSSLHDLPDIPAAIRHAASLLHQHPVTPSTPSTSLCRPRYLVLVHAQGAQHVVAQMHANPVLVPRPLPDETELRDLAARCGMRLVVAPAAPATPRDVAEGYLAVLETLSIGEAGAATMPPPPPQS